MDVTRLFPRGIIPDILDNQPLFPMVEVSQDLKADFLAGEDLPGEIETAFRKVGNLIKPGMKIGITAGSRGIDKLDQVMALVVQNIKGRGGIPFLVPCMGSHGVNAEGQVKVLEGIGITEALVKAPIISQEEVVELEASPGGRTAYMDRVLYESDGIIVVNRIKAHTAFHGPVESGLCKMMAVGMGKQKGAASCHYRGFTGMYETVKRTADTILATGKILFGIGLLENAYGQLCFLEAIPSGNIVKREPELLLRAKEYAPSLPFDSMDLLIVDEMGKDISGSGMDTNVIGRYPVPGMTGDLKIGQIVALSLTKASEGSGHGMGFADFVSARLAASLDLEKTYTNGLTNRTCGPAKMPPVMPNDRTAIQAAARSCFLEEISKIRAVRIKNTHDLGRLWVSPTLLACAKRHLKVLRGPFTLEFDPQGNLGVW